MTCDHVIPKALGGGGYTGNLMPCCRRCNSLKAANPPVPLTFVAVRFASLESVRISSVVVTSRRAIMSYGFGQFVIDNDNFSVEGETSGLGDLEAHAFAFLNSMNYFEKMFNVDGEASWLFSGRYVTPSMEQRSQIDALVSGLSEQGFEIKSMLEVLGRSAVKLKFSNKSAITVDVDSTGELCGIDYSQLRSGFLSPSKKIVDKIYSSIRGTYAVERSENTVHLNLSNTNSKEGCLFCGAEVTAQVETGCAVLCPLCSTLVAMGIPLTGYTKDLLSKLLATKSVCSENI